MATDAAGAMPPTQAAIQSTHPFTCNSCQVAFRSSELQRSHMQTDWHRYNLKRRVASLPPLSSEIFAEKVLANKANAAATAARASFERACSTCQKTYYSENAYQNHLGSQKHRQNLLNKQRPAAGAGADDETSSVLSSAFSLGEPVLPQGTPSDEKPIDADFREVITSTKATSLEEEDERPSQHPTRPHHSSADGHSEHSLSSGKQEGTPTISARSSTPLLTCLFCNFASPTLQLNVQHMERHHGMFVPEKDYLVDLEGFINHLHVKIAEAHRCLYCGKSVHTTSGIQTHMRDRGHCMIAFSSEDEMLDIGQFYDFSSTYSDDECASEQGESGGVRLDGSQDPGRDTALAKGNGADSDWETDSTLSDVPTDEITAVPIDDRSHRYKLLSLHRHHSHNDPRPHRSADGWHSHAHPTPHAVYYDEYELHLPTGRTAGHRSLNRYYRQNLRNYPTAAERAEQRAALTGPSSSSSAEEESRSGERGRQLAVSRADGGLGMLGVTDARKQEVREQEKRERRREMRERTKYAWGNEKRANFQRHYRDPLLQ